MNFGKYRKAILEGLFVVLVFGFTIYGVFHGEDLSKLLVVLKDSNKGYIALGCILVVLYIYSESAIIHYLLNSIKVRFTRWTCFLLSSVGFFFSCITPSASGGQPMQIYYMKKKNMPIPTSTLIMMIITIAYKLVLVIVGVGIAIFGQGMIMEYIQSYRWIFYLGIVLNAGLVSIMLMLVFNTALARKLAHSGFGILAKLRLIKHTPKRIEKLEKSMGLYGEVASYLKQNKIIFVNVMLLTLVQRFLLFSITFFMYKALGLSGGSAIIIILLQASISIAVDMLPLPGGMGISEQLFNVFFVSIFGAEFVLPGLVLSRGISYYIQLILSAVMTMVAQLTLSKGKDNLPSSTSEV